LQPRVIITAHCPRLEIDGVDGQIRRDVIVSSTYVFARSPFVGTMRGWPQMRPLARSGIIIFVTFEAITGRVSPKTADLPSSQVADYMSAYRGDILGGLVSSQLCDVWILIIRFVRRRSRSSVLFKGLYQGHRCLGTVGLNERFWAPDISSRSKRLVITFSYSADDGSQNSQKSEESYQQWLLVRAAK